ncbi:MULTISPECIES: peptidoglycan-binding domain-containing protein [unclassified Yoonia]|uniref:peptidoglycan-binding domain-containing protein n=1 Tax=unclassified Yoonia TaxID=2629118 RepID=UPI002AFE32B3|nr:MULTISPECIES: peptidoglycan-binding domain-containing protein [unclassified Yoonia]
MRRLMLSTAFALCAAPLLADDAALLMGVDRYEEFRRVAGGTDIVVGISALRNAGYAVSSLENGAAADMRRLLDRLAADAADADRLVVGLSGRFVTDGQRTWLLASDAPAQPSLFTLDNAVSIDSVMAVLARTPGRAVLVLGLDISDTSQIDPYLRQGLGSLDVPQGVTVLYGPPNVADNIVTDAVAVQGADVMEFARNTRAVQVLGYQPRSLVMQADVAVVAPTTRPNDTSLPFWEDAQIANTADAYRVFLLGFPDSPYAAEARRRLDQIENDPILLAEQTETALALTRDQRRAIQSNLTLLDYDTRGVDGIFGQGTRRAIRNWQQINGFAQTSYLTTEQISRIDAQASRRQAERDAADAQARAEAERLDRAYWEETGARGTPAGYRAYLNRYPEGLFADQANAALAREADSDDARDDAGNDEARAREAALNINPVMGRLIESRLDQMGFDPGAVDGRFDRDTRSAIGRYQARSGLPATGYLDQPTLARLLADTFGR